MTRPENGYEARAHALAEEARREREDPAIRRRRFLIGLAAIALSAGGLAGLAFWALGKIQ